MAQAVPVRSHKQPLAEYPERFTGWQMKGPTPKMVAPLSFFVFYWTRLASCTASCELVARIALTLAAYEWKIQCPGRHGPDLVDDPAMNKASCGHADDWKLPRDSGSDSGLRKAHRINNQKRSPPAGIEHGIGTNSHPGVTGEPMA
jgi:hypothetical protein